MPHELGARRSSVGRLLMPMSICRLAFLREKDCRSLNILGGVAVGGEVNRRASTSHADVSADHRLLVPVSQVGMRMLSASLRP